MKRIPKPLLVVLALAAVGVALWLAFGPDPDSDGTYVYTAVERTDLRATVSSTGTLQALESVDVGTQVSGQVAAVYADFNDRVEAGDLLAVLDTETLDAALQNALAGVAQAQAGLGQARAGVEQAQATEGQSRAQVAQAQAQLTQAQATLADARATLDRNAPLAERGYLSQSEFQPVQTAVQTAEASVGSQQAALRSAQEQVSQAQAQVASAQAQVASAQAQVVSAQSSVATARKNRSNAEIRAPISGVVVERAVDAGQTVAASFSTPTLFVLAENLDQMEILADVDESDIGQIREGQSVSFTVPAYPDATHDGIVREVRLQPTSEQNVVTYTVVVDADNVSGQLLPGMTATVDFVTDEANAVLAVSTAALQIQPTAAMREALSADGPPSRPASDSTSASARGGDTPPSLLWYLDDADHLQAVPVQVGLSAGALTQVVPVGDAASRVQPGFRVIEQVLAQDDAAEEPSSGFGPPGGGRGGGGGPPAG